jgi:hypothetical protein
MVSVACDHVAVEYGGDVISCEAEIQERMVCGAASKHHIDKPKPCYSGMAWSRLLPVSPEAEMSEPSGEAFPVGRRCARCLVESCRDRNDDTEALRAMDEGTDDAGVEESAPTLS